MSLNKLHVFIVITLAVHIRERLHNTGRARLELNIKQPCFSFSQ